MGGAGAQDVALSGAGMSRTATPRWRAIRRRILDKANWRCGSCGKAGRLEVDHVRPIWKGGAPWAMGNLQALCRGCHIKKSRKEYTGRKRRPPTDAERRWQRLVVEIAAQ